MIGEWSGMGGGFERSWGSFGCLWGLGGRGLCAGEKRLGAAAQFVEVDEGVDDFEEGDYGFIIGPDGELKSIMLPEDLFEDPPSEIKKILKI